MTRLTTACRLYALAAALAEAWPCEATETLRLRALRWRVREGRG